MHTRLLANSVAAWNAWRAGDPASEPDLAGADLAGTDLRRANLRHAHLAGANLEGAHLAGANLAGARLEGAHLRHASLCGFRIGVRDAGDLSLRASVLQAVDLGATDIAWTDLNNAVLRDADLSGADVSGANLRGADLTRSHLRDANLTWANLEEASLTGADLSNADCYEAHFSRGVCRGAHFVRASLIGAKFEGTSLVEADLSRANLCRASLVDADVTDALLSYSLVHGISAWNVRGEPKKQLGLIITRSFAPYDEPELTVDDLDVAQLLYLIVNNHKIRDVIDTMTSKTVLILGRFTTERKRILDAIRTRLRERGYVPIVFDFKPSTSRDLTETVQLLAGLSRFVVADLTDAKSVPQELSHIVASLPSVPVQPLLLRGEREYAMFEHWRRYPWVLPKYEYADESDLLDCFDVRVIEPLEKWRQPESLSAQLDAATRTIEELSRRLDSSSTALSEGAE